MSPNQILLRWLNPITTASTKVGSTAGQAFLDNLANVNKNGFPGRFTQIANRLRLGTLLSDFDLNLLYHAAYTATLCHIAFNGLGGCAGQIRPDRELNRIALEQSFMRARHALELSTGWQALSPSIKEAVHRTFLTAFVEDTHLK